MTLGQSVRSCRKKRGYTQAYLADISGISKNTLFLIETDNVDPKYSTIEILADTLGISVDEMTGHNNRKPIMYNRYT